MNTAKLKSLAISLGLIALSSPIAAHAALSAKVTCEPAREVKGEANPSWAKPWTFSTDELAKDDGVNLVKKVKDGLIIFNVRNVGNGIEIRGSFQSEAKNENGTPKTVNRWESATYRPGTALPLVFDSVYTWSRGKRDCTVTLSDPSAGTLIAALGNSADIAVNRDAIAKNSGRIDQNEKNIAGNRDAITKNSGRIDQNEKNIAGNRDAIAKNSGRIDQNEKNIAGNRDAISQNTRSIASTNERVTENRAEMKSRTTTVNEGYAQKATGTGADWAVYKSGVPFQQNQFCRLIGNFKEQFAKARAERNEIKENIALREREQRLVALMPKGSFENWIVRAVSVTQASDGSAAVLFEMPCDVVVGSYACGTTPSKFLGTIPENSPMYGELAKVRVGDFLGVSGQFYFGQGSKAFEKDRSVASFRQMPAGSHCKGEAAGAKDSEFFAVSTANISALK